MYLNSSKTSSEFDKPKTFLTTSTVIFTPLLITLSRIDSASRTDPSEHLATISHDSLSISIFSFLQIFSI